MTDHPSTDAAQTQGLLPMERKRALYRAQHRGTKEMDWMLGRFAEARLAVMSDAELSTFERFLEVGDPEINSWLLEPAGCSDASFAELISKIRRFHSLAE